MNARSRVLLVAAILLPLTLAGCSAPDEAPDNGSADSASMPDSPISDRMVRCVSDRGFEIKRSLYGGFDQSGSLPSAQLDQFNEAFNSCADETGWSTPLSAFTDAQIAELYAQEVQTRQCLSDLGYPGAEAPSKQTYIDTFASGEQYYAFMAIADLKQSEQDPLIRQCPPPTWFLNISGFTD